MERALENLKKYEDEIVNIVLRSQIKEMTVITFSTEGRRNY